MSTGFPFMNPTGTFPFSMPTGSDRDAEALDMWMKPGVEAFRFWISFFPTAPLFGVEWRFQDMADPAANPFTMPGMMGMPGMLGIPGAGAAAAVPHPGELASPAAADEATAKPVARAADVAGDAATEMTRIAGETGKAAARTADQVMKTGADATKAAVDAEAQAVDQAVDVAEQTGKRAKQATETAATAVEDAATMTGIATEEAAKETARKTERKTTKALKATEATTRGAADATADAVDEAVAAAPKPKMLLGERPGEVDDLKAIKGIGPDLERQLNGLGLYRFDQLAKMTDADLAWIDANITRFKGRCFRDDWVGQAKSRLSK